MEELIKEATVCNSFGDIIWKSKIGYIQGTLRDFEDVLKEEYCFDQAKINEVIKKVKSKGIIPYKHKA